MPGPVFAPIDPRLAPVVESICASDGESGAANSIALPVVSPILCFHWLQAPLLRLDAGASGAGPTWADPGRLRITGAQLRAARLRAHAQVGVVMVRLRPEAAHRIRGLAMHELFGGAAALADLFPPREVALLDERLLEARDTGLRFAAVQQFLLSRLSERADQRLAGLAAQALRQRPQMPIGDLARRLEVSERHLTRVFRGAMGATPKQFARIARLSSVVAAARGAMANWAQIAADCGYADQSHMVHEFQAMVGVAPAALLGTPPLRVQRGQPASPAESDFYNTFLPVPSTLARQGQAHPTALR